MGSSADEVRGHLKTYLFVFGTLAGLTIVTVAASWLEIGVVGGIVLALMIASLKGSLVASYFMHLVSERNALYWILILCALFFVVLLLLPVLQTTETRALIEQVQ